MEHISLYIIGKIREELEKTKLIKHMRDYKLSIIVSGGVGSELQYEIRPTAPIYSGESNLIHKIGILNFNGETDVYVDPTKPWGDDTIKVLISE